MRISGISITALSAAILLALSGRAGGQQGPDDAAAELSPEDAGRREQAKALFEEGIALYRDEKYKEALDCFLDSRKLFASATVVFNIARTCERLRDTSCALEHYRDYRHTARGTEDEALVSERIRALEAELQGRGLQQVTISSYPPGATLFIDGLQKGPAPWTGELIPGKHMMRLNQSGYADLQVELLVAEDHASEWYYTLHPEPVPSEPPKLTQITVQPPWPAHAERPLQAKPVDRYVEQSPQSTVGTWTWVTMGSGLLVLGGAGVLEAFRTKSERDVRELETQNARVAAYDTMKQYQTAARVVAGSGLGITVLGVTLLTLDLTASGNSRKTMAAHCAMGRCELNFRGAW